MSEAPTLEESDLLTIDELAQAVGLTVRTTRYYASLGLLPAPERRGRLAYYGPVHRARLELVRALQDHGFTLQAIERLLGAIPLEATPEELALQRAMLTSWTAEVPREVADADLADLARRPVGERERRILQLGGGIEPAGEGRWRVMPGFEKAVQLIDVDIPEEGLVLAGDAIARHMDSLADELTAILHRTVIAPYRAAGTSPEESRRLERTLPVLRRFVLDGVVTAFQRAAHQVITRSLAADLGEDPRR
ncbi:MerR family transcriptional regulator [Nocardioides sp.]|uniref:MerR family transcriptional regulator n=1 Tax=Nocardioides sp. TaxID=35761 RepID=UPI0035178F02